MEKWELLTDVRATLGEGPVWDEERGAIVWVDILEKRIWEYRPADADLTSYQLDQYVGAAALTESGGLLLAMRHGFYAMDRDTEKLRALGDPEADRPANRFNDGKCGPDGRFWAGTMSMGDKPGQGALYRLEEAGRIIRLVEGVSTSNGLDWSLDGRTFYYIDTPTREVAAFDYDRETGRIERRRTAIRVPEEDGYPDGMTLDAEGKLWIAHWGGSQVTRWDPETGRKLDALALPVPLVTSCAFGGEHYDELYVTSARVGLSTETLEQHPLSGGLFRFRPGVKGRAPFRCRDL
ncbi:SMP-30/gluconolaconase/LRE domain-containing protein [Paenibacillus sp. 32O-W]|uniref:SMP-30/gluconolactonase/LRE family protein n=1 Tax=Paenibacillus sp. 32O-W TaxID=1695218 RepID=UPI000721FB24|nr:SMP-30/gluconolactonase/LRE family protein [Paenibacillus sp. 32O-W]ALS26677.1 SMP-30/gluconolaconase/LRE domain-containing protein [Paenibacillus sp. 32O-W]